jgi:hypothetical protein
MMLYVVVVVVVVVVRTTCFFKLSPGLSPRCSDTTQRVYKTRISRILSVMLAVVKLSHSQPERTNPHLQSQQQTKPRRRTDDGGQMIDYC